MEGKKFNCFSIKSIVGLIFPHSLLCVIVSCRTLEDRAKRLFNTKGVPLESLDRSLFAKTRNSTTTELNENHKKIAFLEAQVYKYADLLLVRDTIIKCN